MYRLYVTNYFCFICFNAIHYRHFLEVTMVFNTVCPVALLVLVLGTIGAIQADFAADMDEVSLMALTFPTIRTHSLNW